MATMRAISGQLREALATTEAYGHNLTAGEARETVLADALRPFVPERFGLIAGTATNVDGRKSQQMDVMLFDRISGTPFVRHRDVGVLPIELVAGAIQVKTSVAPGDVKGIVDNLASLKRLVPDGAEAPARSPMCVGLAYKSKSDGGALAYAFAEANRDLPAHHRANALVIVDKGLVVWSQASDQEPKEGTVRETKAYGVDPMDADQMTWAITDKDSLLLYYLMLSHHLAQYSPIDFNVGAYMAAVGAVGEGTWTGELAEIGYEFPTPAPGDDPADDAKKT